MHPRTFSRFFNSTAATLAITWSAAFAVFAATVALALCVTDANAATLSPTTAHDDIPGDATLKEIVEGAGATEALEAEAKERKAADEALEADLQGQIDAAVDAIPKVSLVEQTETQTTTTTNEAGEAVETVATNKTGVATVSVGDDSASFYTQEAIDRASEGIVGLIASIPVAKVENGVVAVDGEKSAALDAGEGRTVRAVNVPRDAKYEWGGSTNYWWTTDDTWMSGDNGWAFAATNVTNTSITGLSTKHNGGTMPQTNGYTSVLYPDGGRVLTTKMVGWGKDSHSVDDATKAVVANHSKYAMGVVLSEPFNYNECLEIDDSDYSAYADDGVVRFYNPVSEADQNGDADYEPDYEVNVSDGIKARPYNILSVSTTAEISKWNATTGEWKFDPGDIITNFTSRLVPDGTDFVTKKVMDAAVAKAEPGNYAAVSNAAMTALQPAATNGLASAAALAAHASATNNPHNVTAAQIGALSAESDPCLVAYTNAANISLGNGALGNGHQAIALGTNAKVSGYYAVAAGASSLASNFRSSAFGSQAQAVGRQASAIGTFAYAGKEDTLAFPTDAEHTYFNSVVSNKGEMAVSLRTYLDAKADATNVYSKADIDQKNYLTKHQSLDAYAKTATLNAYSNELATAISNTTPSDYATVKANASSALSTANANKTSINTINSAGYITQTKADAAYYPKASGDAWSSYWDGDDVRVTVTNYDSTAHLPTLYLEQRTNDTASASSDTNAFRVVWREMAHWDAFLGSTWNWEDATWTGFDEWRTSLSSQLDEKADRAWGFYDSHTGEYAPDGYTSISSSNVMICAGASYQKTATATCDIWVLTANEPYEPTGVSTNGGFQIKDADGNVQFEIVKGDKRTVKAQSSGVTVDNSTTPQTLVVTYNITADSAPTGEVCLDLAAAEWKAETDSDCPATVTWSGESGAWVARITPTTSTTRCFFKASYQTGGDTYVNNRCAVGMSQLVLNGTTYNLGTAVIDGHTVLTLTPAN